MPDQGVSLVQEDLDAAAELIHATLDRTAREGEPRTVTEPMPAATSDVHFWVKCGHQVQPEEWPDGMREQVKAADAIIPFRRDARPDVVDIVRELAGREYWRERLTD